MYITWTGCTLCDDSQVYFWPNRLNDIPM